MTGQVVRRGVDSMVVEFNRRVRISPEALVNYLDQEAVILDLRSENYYGLDDVGADMLKALAESETISAACGKMLELYDVTQDELERDIREFIEMMLDLGLMQQE